VVRYKSKTKQEDPMDIFYDDDVEQTLLYEIEAKVGAMGGGGMIYVYEDKDYTPEQLQELAGASSTREAIRKLGTEKVGIKGLGKVPVYQIGSFKKGGDSAPHGYLIYVTPQNTNFKQHIWVEGGWYGHSDDAEVVAKQLRKNKQDDRRIPFYSKVEVRPATETQKNELTKEIKKRLEHLRKELRAERISYGELVELKSLVKYIDHADVELLEAAGVDEKFAKGNSTETEGGIKSIHDHNVIAYKDGNRATYFVDKIGDGYRILRHTGSVLMPFEFNSDKNWEKIFKENFDTYEITMAEGGRIDTKFNDGDTVIDPEYPNKGKGRVEQYSEFWDEPSMTVWWENGMAGQVVKKHLHGKTWDRLQVISSEGSLAKGGQSPEVFSPGSVEYKTIDIRSEKGIREAELLKSQGWIMGSTGLDTIQFYRQKRSPLSTGKRMAKGGITLGDINSFIAEINEADGGEWSLGGAYGYYELWAKDKDGGSHRVEVGTKKEIYQALIKYRYNKKYNPKYAEEVKAKGGSASDTNSNTPKMEKGAQTVVELKKTFYTLPKATPVHAEGTKIIIERDENSVRYAKDKNYLYKVYLETPNGEKYWKRGNMTDIMANKRAEDFKDTIEAGYEISERKKSKGGNN